ncbi:aldo/keto reductase [Nigerium massiliense]|uniref:aldo/keto reductase n=1 Tax=Nigerium massiliense TaxID=1522317 RepID=UPI00058F78D5|nr:aldo/keto reductase [Nigerium massiliense]
MTIPAIPQLPLLDGGSIPQVGTGTLIAKGNELADTLAQAIGEGFRLLDTAAQYANEGAVGEAIRRSGVDRAEIFLTTKIAGMDQGRGHTRHGLTDSLRRLATDYVDLLLIHWPNPSRGLALETWQEMLDLQAEGLVRHVGVSNFLPQQLTELHDATGVWPVANQIQLSPALARTELRAFCRERGIVVEGWSPLGQKEGTMEQLVVKKIADRIGVTKGQVILRWAVQQGCVVIPASKNPERRHANADLFGFELTDQDMTDLATLDLGEHAAWDPNTHEEW